jgi:cyanate permease
VAAPGPSTDPVLVKRARIAKLVAVGQRLGYTLFAIATIGFFVGFFGDFSSALVTVIIGSLLVGSLILAPAIVFGYAVKAADREDQGLPSGH